MYRVDSSPVSLSGWGRYPIASGSRLRPRNQSEVVAGIQALDSYLPRGAGRSYGDAGLFRTVVESSSMDCVCAFDRAAGMITVESGMTFHALAAITVPAGWFVAVTPGTSYASIGGAVAADVHGKNHHHAGSFRSCVLSLTLALPSGEVIEASASKHSAVFDATLGGMGLTGFITTVTLQLVRICSGLIAEQAKGYDSIHELLVAMKSAQQTYSVAWVDLLNTGDRFGRGVLSLGDHAPKSAANTDTLRAAYAQPKTRTHPTGGPLSPLRDFVMSLFNRLYFARGNATVKRAVPLSSYFYPLDALKDWNRLYGPDGFIQYQFVIPQSDGPEALDAVLGLIKRFSQRPYLSVLKHFGPQSGGTMSFPMCGPTLAMDFPRRREVLEDLRRLDGLLIELGGRIYLAKDATSSRELLESGYTGLQAFAQLRQQMGATEKIHSDLSLRLGI